MAAARSRPVLPPGPHVSVVDSAWVESRLGSPRLRVLDVRPQGGAFGRPPPEYLRGHVPGAVPLDVRAWLFDADGDVVSAPEVAMIMSTLGVGDEHTVVFVDEGPTPHARAGAWALARYGHPDVHVLDGGHARWVGEGRPVARDIVRHPAASFTARVKGA